MTKIGVIGSGEVCDETWRLAHEVGKEIGKKADLVCGGLGGVMEAASKGCKEADGDTIGIIPSNDKRDANDFIDHVVVTGLGEARNVLVVKSSDVLIAIEGGWGTLSEIAISKKCGKEVIGLGGGFSEQMFDLGFIERSCSPEEAVEMALNCLD